MMASEEAWRLVVEIGASNEKARAEAVAAAIVLAEARGRERFDLAKLETLCDLSTPSGYLDPDAARLRAKFEEWYYVDSQSMTLEEFAREVEEFRTGFET